MRALILLLLLVISVCSKKKNKDYYDYYSYDYNYDYNMAAPYDPEVTANGVIVCVTVVVLLIMLYMSVFGRRMGYSAIRWHVVNICVWGLVHMANLGAFTTKAPFPEWIKDPEWKAEKDHVECLTRSVFPAGMFFIFIERMILTCAPTLENNWIFNSIFAFLILVVMNAIIIFCFTAQYISDEWWFNPIELFNLSTYVLFVIMIFVYFIFCLIGSCMCCVCLIPSRNGKKKDHTARTFVEMWLLFPYALIPSFMYGPSFGMTSVSFVLKYVMKWVTDSGLLEKLMSGGGGDSDPLISMDLMIELMTQALQALPWFLFLAPLVECVLTILCVGMYRQQFFFLLTCGRFFTGKPEKEPIEEKKTWAVSGVAPAPYPQAHGAPALQPAPAPVMMPVTMPTLPSAGPVIYDGSAPSIPQGPHVQNGGSPA